MKRQLSRELKKLGIPSTVKSVDDIIEQWSTLTEEQQVEGYRLLSVAEEIMETAEYNIRLYRPMRDRSSVSSLRKCLANVVPDSSIFDGGLENDSTSCHVAEYDNKVVGYVSYDEDRFYRHIHEVVVAPKYRRKGIMSGLLASVEGTAPLSLLVQSTNRSGREAFHTFGFVQEGSTPDGYLFMVKEF